MTSNSTTPDSPKQCQQCGLPEDVICHHPLSDKTVRAPGQFYHAFVHTSLPTPRSSQGMKDPTTAMSREKEIDREPVPVKAGYSPEQFARAGEQEGSMPTLEPWMTREAFEWMDAALGLDAELHPYLSDLIPSKEEVCGAERERWQKVVDVIVRSADHADAMPKVLQDRAPRKGPHSLKLRRTI